MSDSVTKWHEMQKDKRYIFESPDGGETVTARPFGADVSEREVIKHPKSELIHKAYRLLCEYDEEVIRMAMKIIDIED
jgi:hypothetical protein